MSKHKYFKAILASALLIILVFVLSIFNEGIVTAFFVTLLTLPFVCILFFANWVWNRLTKWWSKLIFIFIPYVNSILFYIFILTLGLSGWDGLGAAILLMAILMIMIFSHSFFILTLVVEKIIEFIKKRKELSYE